MIALSMVLRGRTMSLGGVFMMLSCFVMRVFCHVDVLWNRYFDSLTPVQVMNHWTLSSAHPFGRMPIYAASRVCPSLSRYAAHLAQHAVPHLLLVLGLNAAVFGVCEWY